MKEYKFTFKKKLNDTIGTPYDFNMALMTNSLKNAILKIYDTHEHISKLKVWNGVEYFPVSNLYLDKKEERDQNGFI